MKTHQKLLALLLAVLLSLSLAACVPTGTAVAELSVPEESPNPDAASYEDNLEGLIQYMKDSQLIAGDGISMSADFIGAVEGMKFSYKYMESTMTCELYEFDLDAQNEKAQTVLDSVKSSGKFTVLDKEVSAVLSQSGKFMMIFVSSRVDESSQPFIDRINEKFTAFQGK